MSEPAEEFQRLVVSVVERFARQNGATLEAEGAVRFAERLRDEIEARGLPAALGEGEIGTPGGVDKSEIAGLTARVLEGAGEDAGDAVLREVAKQIVKACFYPEFRVCRDSYRERNSKGGCKRQVLEKARGRVSGAHCVDCPYWTDVSPERHAALLTEGWCGDVTEFGENRAVFLPEDFRALRRWVRAAASGGR